MNHNSMAIIVLCSHLCADDDVKPLEPAEWAKLADILRQKNMQPEDIMLMDSADLHKKFHVSKDNAERIIRLVERSASIAFEIERYRSKGIHIMTRADKHYPKTLKKKLGKSCPPLFYYVGNPAILDGKFVGIVGSRNVSEKDKDFTAKIVASPCSKGFSVVSGGAKGVDITAEASALSYGANCVEYVSDSLLRKIRNKQVIDAVRSNRLLLMSAAKPDAGFSVGMAMMRNKYIYSQSEGTVVVKSDYNKGGTWIGATENMKNNWCRTLVWNNPEHRGNMELISRGATPIDEFWSFELSTGEVKDKTQEEILNLENCFYPSME